MTFGCSKARPPYHLQRFAPSCTGLPPRRSSFSSPRPEYRLLPPTGFGNLDYLLCRSAGGAIAIACSSM